MESPKNTIRCGPLSSCEAPQPADFLEALAAGLDRERYRLLERGDIVADGTAVTVPAMLEAERLPIVEFPQSPQRMVPATQRFYEAVMNEQLHHSGDERLAQHVNNAVLRTDSRGSRLSKESKKSNRKIDLAVASVMAFDRAAHAKKSRARIINLNNLT